MDNILISVIMPALNSERTIEKALISIRSQTVDQKAIEILVIDGGSTDETRAIAARYGATVVDNPRIIPEAAKFIGMQMARGRYGMLMDTDEELTSDTQLQKRLNLFNSNDSIRAILLNGYITPNEYPKITKYVNNYGDPFSYFVYRYDSGDMMNSLRRLKHVDYTTGRMVKFENDDVIPIGDGGSTMFDMDYFRKQFGEKANKQEFVVTVFQSIVAATGCVGIVPGDKIVHYATAKISTYFNKLRFRIRSNVFQLEGHGYLNRAKENKTINSRKYLFLVYCLLIPWPLFDAVYLSVKDKTLFMLMHFVFVYYVLFQLCYNYLKKLLGLKSENLKYGI